ncbi:MAG: hypothetical protein ACREKE_08385 [bacterium]
MPVTMKRRAMRALPVFALCTCFIFCLAYASNLAACACGCQIFDVGVSDMPNTFYQNRVALEYSFMNQNENQSGSAVTAPGLNPDKQLESSFYDVDLAHQFNHDWGLEAELPFVQRYFASDDNGTPGVMDAGPDIESARINTLGDAMLMGMYTGFSRDMSIGLTFGLKLPTGAFNASPVLDRDTEPGTGSTDLLLGGFDRGQFDADLGWYAQALLDAPLYERDGYEAANNLDLTAGLHFDGIERWTHLTPLLQADVTVRGHDSGGDDAETGNYNSGYENLYLTPGLQAQVGPHVQATGLIYLPVTRNVNGDQLVASWLAHVELSYLF